MNDMHSCFFIACECLTRYGAIDNNCRQSDGQCRCKVAFSGRQCELCSHGYFRFPLCQGESGSQ